jgi:hypothetical protein
MKAMLLASSMLAMMGAANAKVLSVPWQCRVTQSSTTAPGWTQKDIWDTTPRTIWVVFFSGPNGDYVRVFHVYADGDVDEPRIKYSPPIFDFRRNPQHPADMIWHGNSGSIEAIGTWRNNGGDTAIYTEQYRPWNYTGKVNSMFTAHCREATCTGFMERAGAC